MYRFSFKVRHKDCAETGLSLKFPKHYITVGDIQSKSSKEKQYFYYISGEARYFDAIVNTLKKTHGVVKEVERSKNTLVLVVVLHQKSYVQNIIQKYHGFFLELHTVYQGYEYWHIGVLNKAVIEPMRTELKKMGELKVLYMGEVDFSQPLLSKQQQKIVSYAFESGYYEQPRKTTIAKIAQALKLNPATVGEHLLKAENKLIRARVKRLR